MHKVVVIKNSDGYHIVIPESRYKSLKSTIYAGWEKLNKRDSDKYLKSKGYEEAIKDSIEPDEVFEEE